MEPARCRLLWPRPPSLGKLCFLTFNEERYADQQYLLNTAQASACVVCPHFCCMGCCLHLPSVTFPSPNARISMDAPGFTTMVQICHRGPKITRLGRGLFSFETGQVKDAPLPDQRRANLPWATQAMV